MAAASTSFNDSGTVEYEVPLPPANESEEQSEVERRNSNRRVVSGNGLPGHRKQAVRTVASTVSSQSQFLPISSRLQLLRSTDEHESFHETEKTDRRKDCAKKTLFLVAVLAMIIVAITALILGALAVKGKFCSGGDLSLRCNARPLKSTNNSDGEQMREELARLQMQVRELRAVANSDSLSATVAASPLYDGCETTTRACNVLPLDQQFFTLGPQGPVCATGRVRIEVDVSTNNIFSPLQVCLAETYILVQGLLKK